VLELRGVPAHPAQLTALGPGLKGCHTLVEASAEAEAVLRPPRTRPVLDEAEIQAVGLFAELRQGWPEPFLDADDAARLIAELKRRGAEASLTARQVQHAVRLALTGRERGLQLPYVVAAVEREDALARVTAASEDAAA
jgi:hypothetical protein